MTTKKNIVLPSMASPVEVGSLRIPNRFTMASLTRNRSVPSNVPNDANELYYEQRAHGGTGLILSEGTLVYQQGTEWPNAPGIWNDEQVAAWKRVTDRVHRQGGHIFCQVRSVGGYTCSLGGGEGRWCTGIGGNHMRTLCSCSYS